MCYGAKAIFLEKNFKPSKYVFEEKAWMSVVYIYPSEEVSEKAAI